ncbi:lectin subunit alpha-like [Musca vetustissima]|uniref:lectin subunit alpha-like n=1 Tax=Musca vetustissima TaxID=27455 RepID=UPI002AB707A4|nr:lectin subunit alpha-like [Musca vetustissima]
MKIAIVLVLFTFCTVSVLFIPAEAVLTLQRGFHGGEFYIEVDQNYNWFEASHECARKNLTLLEILDNDKNQEVLSALQFYIGNSNNFWLGANDEYSEANPRPFYWSSGKLVTFTYWSSGQPDNLDKAEHCLHLWSATTDFQWNDERCTLKMGFICEKPE